MKKSIKDIHRIPKKDIHRIPKKDIHKISKKDIHIISKKNIHRISKKNITNITLNSSNEGKLDKIPKHIFFFWGNKTMSWMRYMSLKSFRIFNPTWKMILYYSPCLVKTKPWSNHNTQDFFSFKGIDYYSKIKELDIEIKEWDISDNTIIKVKNIPDMSASHKSNFLKWCKLYEDGGVYSDLDIIYFKPIDEYYNKLVNGNYNVAICQTGYLSIGFLASSKGSTFYRDIFKHAFKIYTKGSYQSAGVLNIYNLYNNGDKSQVLNIAKKIYNKCKFYNIPFNLVYLPYNLFDTCNTNIDVNTLPKESIGFHWYGGHPVSQKYNNLLNDSNYKNYDNLFCNIAKKIL